VVVSEIDCEGTNTTSRCVFARHQTKEQLTERNEGKIQSKANQTKYLLEGYRTLTPPRRVKNDRW
jgi:hypothetical protein